MASTEEYRRRIQELENGIKREPQIKKMRDDIAEGIGTTGKRQADIEVRQDTLEDDFVKVQQDASTASPSGAEVAVARGGYDTLNKRLDSEHQEVTAQLAHTEKAIYTIGFNFLQSGGVANDDSHEVAQANTTLFRNLMQTSGIMGGESGANIVFPEGTFYFASHHENDIVWAHSNVNIIGMGEDLTILKCVKETSHTGGYSFFRNLSGIENVNYKGFTIDMYNQDMSVYNSAGKAFYFQGVTNATFRDIKLQGTPSTALGIDFLKNVVIDNIYAYECGRLWGVIPKQNDESAPMFDPSNPLSHNTFPGGAGIGIGTGGMPGENFKVVNCVAEKCGHYGIFVEHQYIYSGENFEAIDAVIANNICKDNRFSGMGIRGGTRVSITGNQSYGNGCFGLSVDSMGYTEDIVQLKDAFVASNIFSKNGLDGIHVDAYCNINGLDIKGNKIIKNGEHGVALGKHNYHPLTDYILQENIYVTENTMYDNSKGNIFVKKERVLPIINLVVDNQETESTAEILNSVITDDTNASVKYTGNWMTSYEEDAHNGSFKYTSDSNATAKFKFHGTGFKLIGSTHKTRGIAEITLDNNPPARVDFYSADKVNKQLVYQISNRVKGDHTVTIRPLMQKNENSTDYTIALDAIYILDGEITPEIYSFEESNSKIHYSGDWLVSTGELLSGGSAKYTNSRNAALSFSFTGNGIEYITPTGPGRGIARIVLDGKEYEVDLYSPENKNGQVVFSKKNLEGNNHTFELHSTGRYNLESSSATISVDKFNIFNGQII